jgi:hypothetical protein
LAHDPSAEPLLEETSGRETGSVLTPTTALTLFLLGLFSISAIWFAFLYVRGVGANSLDMEFAKALLQVGVVSVAAAVLSILVFGHQQRLERDHRKRESRQAALQRSAESLKAELTYRDELLKVTLGRLTGTYNRAKRARRRMRALGRRRSSEATHVTYAAYDRLMDDLNDVQLDLEALKSDVRTSERAYPDPPALTPALRSMESYLGAIIAEYEDTRSRCDPGDESADLESLPQLQDFLGPSQESDFGTQFSDQYSIARATLRSGLFHAALPPTDTSQNTTAM